MQAGSYAAGVAGQAMAVRQRNRDECDQKIGDYVAATIASFKTQCDRDASAGHLQCSFSALSLSGEHALVMPGAFASADEVASRIKQRLQSELTNLGFNAATVTERQQLTYERHQWGIRHHSRRQFVCGVSWEGANAGAGPRDARSRSPRRRGGGAELLCPVCHETAPAVCLVPCGHVVCRECSEEMSPAQLGTCPTCREGVTSVTRGVFPG